MKTTVISLFMLLLAVSLAAVTQSVDFNNTSDLSTYFNVSNTDLANSTSGGIGSTGAVQFPFIVMGQTRTLTYKTGFELSQLDSPVTVSAYIYSFRNGGYAGMGLSSLPTNTSSAVCQVLNTPALGMEFYSSGAHLYSNTSQHLFSYFPDIALSWYKVVLTITPRAGNIYDLNYKLYLADFDGSSLTLTKEGSWSFYNTTIGNVDGKVYPYLTIDGARVTYMDNFSVSYPGAAIGVVIEPAFYSTPILAAVIGDLDAISTGMIQAAYLCTYSGTTDLEVPLLVGEHGYAHYSGAWHEGDYALNPGFVTWLDVPFGAKGSIPVVIIQPAETLPVTMSSFTATATSQTLVRLQWTTESESNILGFNVYRSDDADIANAVKLNAGFIEGTNSSIQHTYNYSDSEFEPGATYYYWVESAEMNNSNNFYGPVSVFTGNEGEVVPSTVEYETGIVNVYPNPFRPSTEIAYKLRDTANVTIGIYNQKGQLIRSLLHSSKESGIYQIGWDGKDSNGKHCASGIYFARMQAGSVNSFYKMTLVK
ncbi:MAG: hypothetical protein CVU50_08465 [Candidatus Cloacimonetes bacterium HGW-Cloacimonetes-3]|jgi:hypothetical protein|nr:MAG: hypothetical protein CVU50_08465 [Candidatus Cloacimonetes bacterium HGW-Cloacimonetes-3]